MKPKPDKLNEEDTALLRHALRGVKPLATAPRVTAPARRLSPQARFTRAARAQGLEESVHGPDDEPAIHAADATHFARAGVADGTLRKLRRGQYRIHAQLDLHGLNSAQAKAQLRDFLLRALDGQARCVRIVHGKGLRSGAHGPVLRQLVNGVLRRTSAVLAFTSARPADGGTGALYVLLDDRR